MSEQIDIVQLAKSLAKKRQDELAKINTAREANNLYYELEMYQIKNKIISATSKMIGHTTNFGEVTMIGDPLELKKISDSAFCIVQIGGKKFAGMRAWYSESDDDKSRFSGLVCSSEFYPPDYRKECYICNWFRHNPGCCIKNTQIHCLDQTDSLLKLMAENFSLWL